MGGIIAEILETDHSAGSCNDQIYIHLTIDDNTVYVFGSTLNII